MNFGQCLKLFSQCKLDLSSIKPQTAMVDNIASHNKLDLSSIKPQTAMVDNIIRHNKMNLLYQT